MTAASAHRRPLTATYRVQMNRAFTLRDAQAIVPYLDSLGVSHLYVSPLLASRAGSTHGYDVIDPTRLNPELGTDEDFAALATALHKRGMGLVLDVVPNHMATGPGNSYWDEVLTHGPGARHAGWFDIDWGDGGGKVVLPVLGAELDEVLARGDLTLDMSHGSGRIVYKGHSFPVDPATFTPEMQLALFDPEAVADPTVLLSTVQGRDGMRRLLDAQHYRLTFWKCAPDDLNYRRFFDVNDLVALRMEDPTVFAATHALVLAWVRDGLIDGLRVDHVDGLRDPRGYLVMLRDAVRSAQPNDEAFPIFVEKILSPGEVLRGDWPVQGTTGYDFLDDVEDAFVEARGFASIEAWYRRMRRLPIDYQFADCAHTAKLAVLDDALQPDLDRLVMLLRPIVAEHHDWADSRLRDGLAHFIAALPVYRTYVDAATGTVADSDRGAVERAVVESRRHHPATADVVEFIADIVLGAAAREDDLRAVRVEFVARLQQTSGPAMAKGVEDTALYQYVPLVSRNEVGGGPDRPLDDTVNRLHAANLQRRDQWPHSMLCTTTHDTKRSADVRSRIEILSTMPRDWERCVMRWRRLNKRHRAVVSGRLAPDTNTEYLLYQTLLALWPTPGAEAADELPDSDWLDSTRQRLEAYMLKAAREAKTRTKWVEPDAAYERALRRFVASLLDGALAREFLADIGRMAARVAPLAEATALSRVLLHLTAPGTPDIYQGDESWNFALVDPDNRRPVDYDTLASGAPTEKLRLTRTLLALRRENAELFRCGDYVQLAAHGGRAAHLMAFARSLPGRSHVIVLAPRNPNTMHSSRDAETPSWGNTTVALPEGLRRLAWRSVLSGQDIPSDGMANHLPVGQILKGVLPGLLLSLE